MLKILSYGRNSQSIRGDANARQKINLRSYQICNYIYKVKVHHGLFGDNILWFLPSKRSASQQQVAQSLSLTIPLYLEDCQSWNYSQGVHDQDFFILAKNWTSCSLKFTWYGCKSAVHDNLLSVSLASFFFMNYFFNIPIVYTEICISYICPCKS